MNFFKLKSKGTTASTTKAVRPISPSGKHSGQTVRSVLPFGNKKKSKKQPHPDSFGRDLNLSRTPSTLSTDSHSSSGSSWSCHGNQLDDCRDLDSDVIYSASSNAPSNAPSVYPHSSAASSVYHVPFASPAIQSREQLDRMDASQSSSFFHRSNGSQSSFHPSNRSQSSFHHPHPFLPGPGPGQVQQANSTVSRANLHASLPSDVAEYNPFGCRPYPVPASLHLSIESLPSRPSPVTTDDDNDDAGDNNNKNNDNDGNCRRLSLNQLQSSHLAFPAHPASSRARAGPPSLPTTANRSRANSTASNRTTGSSVHSHSTGAGADSTFHGSSAFLASGLATRARSTSVSSSTLGTYHPPHPSPLGHPAGRLVGSQDDSDEGEETLQPSACCPVQPLRSDDPSGFPFPSSVAREQEQQDEAELVDVWKHFMRDATLPTKQSVTVSDFVHKPTRPPPPPPPPSSALPPVPPMSTATPKEGLKVKLPAEEAVSEPFGLAYLIDDDDNNDDENDDDDDLTVNLSHLVPSPEVSLPPLRHVPPQLPLSHPSRFIGHRDRQSTLSTRSSVSFASSVSSVRSSEPATPSFPLATTAPLFYHPDGSYVRASGDQPDLGSTQGAHLATDALQTDFWRASKTLVRAPTWWSGPPPGTDATLVHSDSSSELESTERHVLGLETTDAAQSNVAWGEAL